MGCDIHIKTEIKTAIDGKNTWVSSDYYKKNRYYGVYGEEEREWETAPIYDARDYSLFSLLADVRSDGVRECICKPKGLPKDICKEIREELEYWEDDGHSHSYFTLTELIEAKKNFPIITQSGMISKKAAEKLDKDNILPSSWCMMTSDKDCVYREWKRPNNKLDLIIDSLQKRYKEFFYCEDNSVQADKIRIVFWFDN